MAFAADQQAPYPVRLTMDYPARLSRLSTFFRIILVIPVLIFLGLVGATTFDFSTWGGDGGQARNGAFGAGVLGGGVVAAIWATILVKGRIPRWLFDFQVGLNRFTQRAVAYVALLTDQYPAFEGDWVLDYEVDYPERLSRWKLLFWKLLTSIPHFIVLALLTIAAVVVVIIGWFAILFSGAFPRGLHTFVVGVMRWGARVGAYFQSLTDEFPPYSLDEDAGPGSASAQTISAVIGGLIVAAVIAGAIALAVFLIIYLNKEKTEAVSLDSVLAGDVAEAIELDNVTFTLVGGADPAAQELLQPRPGHRLVAFTVEYVGEEGGSFQFDDGSVDDSRDIDRDTLRLETDGDNSISPLLLTFDGIAAPLDVPDDVEGTLTAIFEIEVEDTPEELRAYPNGGNDRHVAWELE